MFFLLLLLFLSFIFLLKLNRQTPQDFFDIPKTHRNAVTVDSVSFLDPKLVGQIYYDCYVSVKCNLMWQLIVTSA